LIYHQFAFVLLIWFSVSGTIYISKLRILPFVAQKMCVQSVISHLLFLLHRWNWCWSASTKLQLGVVGEQQIAPPFLLGVIFFGIFFHFSSLVNWNLDLEQA
jgi:hypothetical protein